MIRRVLRRWLAVCTAALGPGGGFAGTAAPASAAPIPEPANDPFYSPLAGYEATAPGHRAAVTVGHHDGSRHTTTSATSPTPS